MGPLGQLSLGSAPPQRGQALSLTLPWPSTKSVVLTWIREGLWLTLLSATATGTALEDRQLGSRNWEKGLVAGPVGQVLVSGSGLGGSVQEQGAPWDMARPPPPTQSYLKHGDPVPGRPGWGRGGAAVPAPLDLLSEAFLSLIRGARCSQQRPLPPTMLTGERRRLGPAVINCCTERGPSFFHLLMYLSTPFGLSYSHLAQGPRTCWLSPAQGQRVQARKLSNYHSRSLMAPHAALKACWSSGPGSDP